MKRFLVTIVALLSMVPQLTFAQEAQTPTAVFLDRPIKVAFPPRQAFFLVNSGSEQWNRVEGVLIPPYQQKPSGNVTGVSANSTAESAAYWRVGGQFVPPSGAKELTISLILVGEEDRYDLVAPWHLSLDSDTTFGFSIDKVREKILQQKAEVRSWQTQIGVQDESLKRLRSDADVIADLGRIVEVREEIEQTKSHLLGLEKDRDTLQGFVKLARQRPQPKNFVGRERQLVRQLTDLVAVTKTVESGEIGRRSNSEKELQRRLALVEATRSQNFDALQRELVQLRKQRMDLELSLGIKGARSSTAAVSTTAESPENYVR